MEGIERITLEKHESCLGCNSKMLKGEEAIMYFGEFEFLHGNYCGFECIKRKMYKISEEDA